MENTKSVMSHKIIRVINKSHAYAVNVFFINEMYLNRRGNYLMCTSQLIKDKNFRIST